jgi:hypothetical protein
VVGEEEAADKPGPIADWILRRATGRGWDDWFQALDRGGAERLAGQREVAAWLRDQYHCAPSWSQTIAAGYLRARVPGQPGQTADGFVAGVSRVVAAPASRVWRALADDGERLAWLCAATSVTASTPEKSLRLEPEDGTRVDLDLYKRGEAKCALTVQHRRLADAAAAAAARTFWAEALDRLRERVAAEPAPDPSPATEAPDPP